MLLHTEEIRKSYKGRKVVDGVTVNVNQGEIAGDHSGWKTYFGV